MYLRCYIYEIITSRVYFIFLSEMASIARTSRTALRLLATKSLAVPKRGYADEMSFTFAAANQVSMT